MRRLWRQALGKAGRQGRRGARSPVSEGAREDVVSLRALGLLLRALKGGG